MDSGLSGAQWADAAQTGHCSRKGKGTKTPSPAPSREEGLSSAQGLGWPVSGQTHSCILPGKDIPCLRSSIPSGPAQPPAWPWQPSPRPHSPYPPCAFNASGVLLPSLCHPPAVPGQESTWGT